MAVVQSEGALRSVHRPDWSVRRGSRGVELYSGLRASYAELYRTQPNVRTVVRFLGRNIASLPLGAFRRISRSERVEYDRSTALGQFVRRPAPRTTRHRLIRSMVEDLAIFDHYAALKVRAEGPDRRLSLIRLPANLVEPVGDSWFEPDAIRVLWNRGPKDYPLDQVVWIHGNDPLDPRGGLSPLEALRSILAEEAAAGEWREQFWRGGARVAGIIERPKDAGKWGPEARDRFREEWHAAYAGTLGEEGRTPVLEDGMVWKDATFSPKDAEYLGARKLSREEVAAAYFIPPAMLGILEHANFANIREQHIALYQDTLGPWLDWLESELELQVLDEEFVEEPDAYLDFRIEAKLRGSFEEQASALQTAVGAPWMLRNEARALRELPPLAGGDEPVVPLNVLIGGQASPTDSAPPPGPSTAAATSPGKGSPSCSRCGGAKAVGDLPRDVQGYRVAHEEVLRRYFGRQRDVVLGPLREGSSLDATFDSDRWDGELRRDFLGLALDLVEDIGSTSAERFGLEDFDPDLAYGYLDTNARIAAEGVNGTTRAQLAAAGAEHEAGADGDPLGEVFALAVGLRAVELSITRVTGVSSFARYEGARQAGAGFKVWNVNASESRHSALNGETVPMGETFSNGLRWPGDSAGGADETAGCVCSLDFTNDG